MSHWQHHDPAVRELIARAEARRDAAEVERDRLRAGIAALAEKGEADGRGNSRDLARSLRALLDGPR